MRERERFAPRDIIKSPVCSLFFSLPFPPPVHTIDKDVALMRRLINFCWIRWRAPFFCTSSFFPPFHLYQSCSSRILSRARVFFSFFSFFFHFLSTSYPSQITGLAHTRRSRMDTPTYLPASTCLYLPACLPAVSPLLPPPSMHSLMHSFSCFASMYMHIELCRADERAKWRTRRFRHTHARTHARACTRRGK